MPSSKPIIRGEAAAQLKNWSIDQVGSPYTNKMQRLLDELSHHAPVPTEPPPLTPQERALQAKEQELQEREAHLAILEQKTIREAQATGLQRGYEAGWEAASQERTALLTMADSLHAEFESFKTNLADHVLDLAIQVSQKIIGDSIALHPEHAWQALKALINDMQLESKSVTLYAHPETLKVLDAQLGDTQELKSIRIQADPNQTQGGFILHHPEGQIDASMETRWQRTIESLGRKQTLKLDQTDLLNHTALLDQNALRDHSESPNTSNAEQSSPEEPTS